MKSYKDVVRDRYDNREKELTIFDNIYSEIHPIGFYMNYRKRKTFRNIFLELSQLGYDIKNAKIVDVGCGHGETTRYISEMLQNTENICGFDLSEYSIQQSKKMNSSIRYFIDDIVEIKNCNEKFDIVLAVNVFMHLNTVEQINKALSNIYKMLNTNGIFIWYDAYWDSHFKCDSNAESCGFNLNEMELFASNNRFRKIIYREQFKYLFNDARNSTAYMGGQQSEWLLDLLEEKMEGLPVNIIMVFAKEN